MASLVGPSEGLVNAHRQELLERYPRVLEAAIPVKEEQIREETNAYLTFRMAGESWLHRSQARRRNPIGFNTAKLYGHHLKRWLYPVIGEMLLSDVKNMQAKAVIDKMHGNASGSVVDAAIVILQQVVASVVDADGQPLYDVKWNRDAMDAPAAASKEMKAFTAEQIEQIIERAEGQYKVLFALSAAGLRIGEALAVEIDADPKTATTLSKDCRVLNVQSVILQTGKKQGHPKTKAGIREVDICSTLAAMLKDLIGNRTSGYIFQTASGKPILYSNLRKNILDPILYDVERKQMKREGKTWKCVDVKTIPGVVGPPETEGYGCHSFRRFRATYLAVEGVPSIFTKYWLGHGKKTITEEYQKAKQETVRRKEWAEKCGLGFKLPNAIPRWFGP